jgi:hypothetical protein
VPDEASADFAPCALAERHKAKLGLFGPSESGKTMSALKPSMFVQEAASMLSDRLPVAL